MKRVLEMSAQLVKLHGMPDGKKFRSELEDS